MTSKDENTDKINVHLGFPNAALDSADAPLDLNKLVVKNRSSTFYMRVDSSSYEEMGISSGDILTIDRAQNLRSGDIFVGSTGGEFIIRKLGKEEETEVDVFGAVTHIIHKVKRVNGK